MNRNDAVALIDALNERATCDSRLRFTVSITSTMSLPLTSAATIRGAITPTATWTQTIA